MGEVYAAQSFPPAKPEHPDFFAVKRIAIEDDPAWTDAHREYLRSRKLSEARNQDKVRNCQNVVRFHRAGTDPDGRCSSTWSSSSSTDIPSINSSGNVPANPCRPARCSG